AHHLCRLGEVVAAPRADLDLGRDQLPDEVVLDRSARRGGLDFLEAVRQLERLGIEDGELLLDRHREIGRGLELLARKCDLLLRAQALGVTHAGESSRTAPAVSWRRSPTTRARSRSPGRARPASGAPYPEAPAAPRAWRAAPRRCRSRTRPGGGTRRGSA